ncbi:MAG: ribosomal protein S18-alanine N-acetyltransferase [Desulfurococcaceae archaeon]
MALARLSERCASLAGQQRGRSVHVRDFGPDDVGGVLRLEERCFDADLRYPRWLFELYAARGAVFRVAVLGQEVVGYVIADVEGGLCHVISIAVDPEHRATGIGTALLCSAVEECRRRGTSKARLEVSVDNLPALRLYEKLGFEAAALLRDYYGRGRDAYLMVADV